MFNLEKMFVDVFAPVSGDTVTILLDEPHGIIQDNTIWQERRRMAEDWLRQIGMFAPHYQMSVNTIITYPATGAHHGELPLYGTYQGGKVRIEEIINNSTILIAMTEYSATSPLFHFAQKYHHLRIASMPGVTKSMEEGGLSANYEEIAAACQKIAPNFEKADFIEVTFSTGHKCVFDLTDHKQVFKDDGNLHPGTRINAPYFTNLPAGEVCVCPNESQESKTTGEIPVMIDNELMIYVVEHNQIVDVVGDGKNSRQMRKKFKDEAALCNIAEVAIGVNPKARVTGNVLEDEKAGFHWAYGRSDLFGGKISPQSFSAPDKVAHIDTVYARKNPILCSRLDFVFHDNSRRNAILDGNLQID